ncbi:hypothetical protein IV38_GL001081 [Lactobacillus selangorensis]|uniref:HMA domain-containing protein n=1 Tax=Lactobacillus selangorensis TaxID=81857 RepID=A0A0R2G7U1_9LACO|nr:hypothetical protein IV38_GL001081 [Lactobacillus selangorensis]KRN32717.1 hypothetical protein IV40_GL000772 [Lactobacillus selangorensis]
MQKIQKALQKTNGVQDVQVRFNAGKAIVQADPDVVSSQALADVVTKLGYTVKKITTK